MHLHAACLEVAMSLLGITKIARLRPNWTVYVLPRLTYVYLSINGLGGIYVVITGPPDHFYAWTGP